MYSVILILLLGVAAYAQFPNCGVQQIRPDETLDQGRALDEDGVVRVVGGREARPNSWPWQISLRTASNSHTCGGSLIGGRWVITAAHCVNNNPNPGSYSVDVGRHFKDGTTDSSYRKIFLSNLFIHPLYNPNGIDNDIAVLELQQEPQWNAQVHYICLPTRDISVGEQCWVSGWGATQGTCCFGNLKQAYLPHIPNNVCSQSNYWSFRILPSMLCAGWDGGTHGGCFGDSGGPYQCKRGNRFELLGDVSWGSSTCRAFQKPTVFGRIHYLSDFIELVTGLRPSVAKD